MTKWKTMPGELPLDGVVCWVRLNYWFGSPFEATYSVANKEWTSEENGLKYPVWSISRWKYDQEFLYATLEATGTGAGVSTLRLEVDRTQTINLTGGANFYTDAAGTIGESTQWEVTTGALRTIYVKCVTGSATMQICYPANVIKWGSSNTDGWVSGENASKITIEGTRLALAEMRVAGQSSIIGALPTGLTSLWLNGDLINWTYTGALPTGLTYLHMNGNLINWTYTGA
jgi:hypothetical protein